MNTSDGNGVMSSEEINNEISKLSVSDENAHHDTLVHEVHFVFRRECA
jgi:hypothetical protein